MNSKHTYLLIFIGSLLATLLSLYYGYFGDLYSNFQDMIFFDSSRGITPCEMCRYIRIAQYPILIISSIALIKEEYHSSSINILVLSILGMIFSTYKLLLEQGLVQSAGSGLCGLDSSVSCGTATYLLGTPLSFAGAGLLLFVLITGLLLIRKDS